MSSFRTNKTCRCLMCRETDSLRATTRTLISLLVYMSTEQTIKIPHIWACFVSSNNKRNTIYIKISSHQWEMHLQAWASSLKFLFSFPLCLLSEKLNFVITHTILLFWDSDETLADRPNGSARLSFMKMIISSSNKIMFSKNVNTAKT